METLVASCQFNPRLGDPRRNIDVALQLVFEAAAKGARVIVLPELCLSGRSFKSGHEAAQSAQQHDGWQSAEFTPIIREFNCHVVVGYVELDEGCLYNSAVLLGPTGVEANFRKHNMSGRDHMWATPGESLDMVIPTSTCRLGILIGKDVSNTNSPSGPIFREGRPLYRHGSVDVIAHPTNSPKFTSYPSDDWMTLAEATRTSVIVSNRIGVDDNTGPYGGGSCVVDRDLNVWTYGSSFDDTAVVGGMIRS